MPRSHIKSAHLAAAESEPAPRDGGGGQGSSESLDPNHDPYATQEHGSTPADRKAILNNDTKSFRSPTLKNPTNTTHIFALDGWIVEFICILVYSSGGRTCVICIPEEFSG